MKFTYFPDKVGRVRIVFSDELARREAEAEADPIRRLVRRALAIAKDNTRTLCSLDAEVNELASILRRGVGVEHVDVEFPYERPGNDNRTKSPDLPKPRKGDA